MIETRLLQHYELHDCFVRECQCKAHYAVDNGNGGIAFVCAEHLKHIMIIEEAITEAFQDFLDPQPNPVWN